MLYDAALLHPKGNLTFNRCSASWVVSWMEREFEETHYKKVPFKCTYFSISGSMTNFFPPTVSRFYSITIAVGTAEYGVHSYFSCLCIHLAGILNSQKSRQLLFSTIFTFSVEIFLIWPHHTDQKNTKQQQN